MPVQIHRASAEPLVSVIIPAYNCCRLLPDAIGSALAQTYRKVEIIVVDDGSTDATPQVARLYGNRITYVRQQNMGTPAARNAGIRRATGDLIALLDQDDRWLPDKLEQQVPLFEDPAVGMVHGGGRVIDLGTQCVTSEFYPPLSMNLHEILSWCRVAAATAVFRRAAVAGDDVFDTSMGGADDWDLWIRLAAVSRIIGCGRIVAEIREHRDNQSKRLGRMYQSASAVIGKRRAFHEKCIECDYARRRARSRLAEDYYAKACRHSLQAAGQGRLMECVLLRLGAMCRNPRAIARYPRRLAAGLSSVLSQSR